MTTFRVLPAALAATAALLLPSPGRAAHGRHHGASVTLSEKTDPVRCDQLDISFGHNSAFRSEERVVVPAGRDALRIVVPESSGARIRGTDRHDFEVLACKAAPSEEALSAIRLDTSNGVTVAGPRGGEWVGYLLIAAPRDASIDVEAKNGPISLSGLGGAVVARAQNGPISIRDSAGEIQAEAQNGPIHVQGNSGHVRVQTENGPIGVSLTGSGWSGDGLDARAANGPIHVAIPDGYASAALIEATGHSPWSCSGKSCAEARRVDDDERQSMEFGAGPTVIRVSTENGPVSIATGKGDEEDD